MSTANKRFMNQFKNVWNKNSDLPRNKIEAKRLFILKAFTCLKPHCDEHHQTKILAPAKKELLDKIGMFSLG